jgi:GT2 family glycosyltransferase
MNKIKSGGNPKYIVIARHHNTFTMTCQFIDEINKIDYENKEILIVDDGSTDKSGLMIKNKYSNDVTVIHSKEYLKYCKGFNYGIRYALNNSSADYFFIVNNDTRNFSKDYFTVANKNFKEYENIGKFGSVCYDYDGNVRSGGELMHKIGINLVTPTEGYIIPRKVFEKIGLFDESLVRYYEDLDLIKRMYDHNFITHCDTSISFEHLGGGTTKNKHFLRNYYKVRNLIWFLKRYGKNVSMPQKYKYLKAYGGTHVYNLIKCVKKLEFMNSIIILYSILLGLSIGFMTKWKPKTDI